MQASLDKFPINIGRLIRLNFVKYYRGDIMNIGTKILEYRKKVGLSQEELGFELNVSRQSVSLWETNQAQPTIENLKSLAIIFNVSLDELLGIEKTKSDEPNNINKDFLFQTTTHYNREIYKNANKIVFKKYFNLCYIFIIISALLIPIIIFSTLNNAFCIVPIVFISWFVGCIIKYNVTIKENAKKAINAKPNLKSELLFFTDKLVINSTSINTNSTTSVMYNQIEKILQDDKYIYLLLFDNTFCAINIENCESKFDDLVKILNIPKKDSKLKPQIKVLLLVTFIISFFSLHVGLAFVAISCQTAPFPDFPFTILEHIWKMLFAIPIPLTSIILGIIFLLKGYKCKKNIIAGYIMFFLLCLYGSFASFFPLAISHDKNYVDELTQKTNIVFPEPIEISISYDLLANCESFAMIKFDDNNPLEENIVTNDNWKIDRSFIPIDFLDPLSVAQTTNYHYFTVYNVDKCVYNDFEGKIIYFAYNVDRNILYVYCYK